jgi:hypothetical protein
MGSADLKGWSAPAFIAKLQNDCFVDPRKEKVRSGWKLHGTATDKLLNRYVISLVSLPRTSMAPEP